jgi:arylamine N-acetyltransferase
MIPSAYTPAEIDAYLEFVRVPAQLRRAPPTPELLKTLHVHHLCSLPFEDLDIHYSPHHGVNIDLRHVYDKFMAGRGRGGYCMEQGLFFCNILRGLGFHAYPTGARVRPRVDGEPAGPYMGL